MTSEKATDPGVARILVGLVGQPTVVNDVETLAAPIRSHRAELQDLERLAVEPDPPLAKQHGPPHRQRDDAGDDHHRHRCDEHPERR